MIFAGFLLVHEAVLGPGGLQPVTGTLVLGKDALQLEECDDILIHIVNIMGITKTIFVKRNKFAFAAITGRLVSEGTCRDTQARFGTPSSRGRRSLAR